MSRIKLKICGMRESSNIAEVSALNPDFIGFIFYKKSPRYAGEIDLCSLKSIPENIQKTGVFVNESIELINEIARKFGLSTIQLHGNESPLFCKEIMNCGYKIIKAIAVKESADVLSALKYDGCCDYILFDTKTELKGGSGRKFERRLIEFYSGSTPFFISGGICTEEIEELLRIDNPLFYGIDINSKFETAPGLKDPVKIKEFKITLNKYL